jgi:hypothetical protein
MATWDSASPEPFRLAAVFAGPMDRPPVQPARRAVRKSGGDCDIDGTLGRAPAGEISPDDTVHDWHTPSWMAG